MRKLFCDLCGEEIKAREEYNKVVFEVQEEDVEDLALLMSRIDACQKCTQRIMEMAKRHSWEAAEKVTKPLKSAEETEKTGQQAMEPAIPPRTKRTRIDKGKVIALRKAGWSMPKIADEVKASTAYVHQVIQKWERLENEKNN